MRSFLNLSRTLSVAALALPAALFFSATAQAQRGQWPLVGNTAAHDNWQPTESKITTSSFSNGTFQFLWKLKLSNAAAGQGFSEAIFIPSHISSSGFKDVAVLGDSNTLYTVDYALGTLLWKTDLKVDASNGCAPAKMQILMEPPRVIRFGAKRTAPVTPGVKPPPPPPPPDPAHRWIGATTQGGGFGLKGIYALTSDGMLHELNMANGTDFAPPEKFLPGASTALNMFDKVLYAETSSSCDKGSDAVWSMDINTQANEKATSQPYTHLQDITGPAIASDGTLYVSTTAIDSRVHSVEALAAKSLTQLDYYAPAETSSLSAGMNFSPIVIGYKDRELVAAAGSNGNIVLLDPKSLGGSDHHAALAMSTTISAETKPKAWEGLASWRDKSGDTWVLASVVGPVTADTQFAMTNGDAPHGSIVAFKLTDNNGVPKFMQMWVSRDLMTPAPPVVANGVVFALSGDSMQNHAVLYALDATTGKELYTSGDTIKSSTDHAGLSVGDGHVFFTTQDNVLYAFGFPLEH